MVCTEYIASPYFFSLQGNINVGYNATNLLSLLTFLDDIALLHGKNITVNATSIGKYI